MELRVWERGCLSRGERGGGVAVRCTYDYRGVPVGDECVVVAFCIAERGVAGLGDGALEMVWGCGGRVQAYVSCDLLQSGVCDRLDGMLAVKG